jgi:hypothetical protein
MTGSRTAAGEGKAFIPEANRYLKGWGSEPDVGGSVVSTAGERW